LSEAGLTMAKTARRSSGTVLVCAVVSFMR
jgi:hypothetical protein